MMQGGGRPMKTLTLTKAKELMAEMSAVIEGDQSRNKNQKKFLETPKDSLKAREAGRK